MLVAVDGTVLALWEGVKVCRSEDGGQTWGPEITVGKGFMGGGAIVNEAEGQILAFVEKNHPPAPLAVYRSQDHGKTWSGMEVVIKPDANGSVPSMHMNEAGITLRHGDAQECDRHDWRRDGLRACQRRAPVPRRRPGLRDVSPPGRDDHLFGQRLGRGLGGFGHSDAHGIEGEQRRDQRRHSRRRIGLADLAGVPQGSEQGDRSVTLVAQGSTWTYLDDGSDQGTTWRDPAFDDSAWASGPAQLGCGEGDEANVVSYGPDGGSKYTTTVNGGVEVRRVPGDHSAAGRRRPARTQASPSARGSGLGPLDLRIPTLFLSALPRGTGVVSI